MIVYPLHSLPKKVYNVEDIFFFTFKFKTTIEQ